MEKTSMNPPSLATLVAVAGVIAATPALAQQGQGSAASPGSREAASLQSDAEQIRQMQVKLNQLGFSSGHVDGIWGPDTSTAVLHFQQIKNLHATGRLDDETLRALGLTGAVAAPSAVATQAEPPRVTPAPTTPAQLAPAPASSAPPVATGRGDMGSTSGAGTTPNSPLPTFSLGAPTSTSGAAPGANPGGDAGRTVAGGHNNQAVATTHANAPRPAHGANSFTKGEARARISREGFQEVGDLSKDNAGVWRGKATRNGQPAHVWLDYKGNIGQE